MTSDDRPIKKTKVRSAAYPAIPLEEAIGYSNKLFSGFQTASFDRKAAAKVIGHDSVNGASAAKIAALVHFGLLDKISSGYSNSELARQIHYPPSDQEKESAISKAVQAPKLFSTLILLYSGHNIPPTLNNVLINNHNISLKVADQVVQTFKESVEYAGVYKNGVLKSVPDGETKAPKEEAVNAGADRRVEEVEEPIKLRDEHRVLGMHNVPLSNGVIVSYPANIAFKMQTNEGYKDALKGLEKVAKEAASEEDL